MHTEHWGPVDGFGPRALLLHGITSSAATMWELGSGLAKAGWSVTALDLPGHGRSEPAQSYRFDDLADTIHDQVGDGFDLLLGHSLGGAIGIVLLARHPATARRAVLLDPALVVSREAVATIADGLAADKTRDDEELVAAQPAHWNARTVRTRVDAVRAADVDAVRAYGADNVDGQPGSGAHDLAWDVTHSLAEVTVPVLVLVPGSDSVIAPALVEEIHAAHPTWTFETVADAGHSLHRDRPEDVLERSLRA